jgi:hypothetical protein
VVSRTGSFYSLVSSGSLLLSFLLIFFLIHSSSVKCTEIVEHVKLWQCVCIELEATIDLSHFNVAFKL